MSNFELGLILMVVGMATVYAILLLVIGLGKGLILLINKYAPEEIIAKNVQRATAVTAGNKTFPETAAVAIVSSVSILTGGQGKVTKIEKM
ncbi:MAG: OadG family protein [Tannerella sp.]|nr:OadG family protein [Tannerella sp.]